MSKHKSIFHPGQIIEIDEDGKVTYPKTDTARLDWLVGEPERLAWLRSLWFVEDDRPNSPREAIDKQMGEEEVKPIRFPSDSETPIREK